MKTHEIVEQLKAHKDRELDKTEQQFVYNMVKEWLIADKDEVEPQGDKFIEAFMQMVLNKSRHYYHRLTTAEYERLHTKDLQNALFESKVDIIFWDYINRFNRDADLQNRLKSGKSNRSCWWTLLVFFLLFLAIYLYYAYKMSKQVDAVESQQTTMLLTPAEGCDNIFVSPRK